jgi:hypothetical protein
MRMRIARGLGAVLALQGAVGQEPPMGPLRPDQTAFLARQLPAQAHHQDGADLR